VPPKPLSLAPEEPKRRRCTVCGKRDIYPQATGLRDGRLGVACYECVQNHAALIYFDDLWPIR
jgi:hypothetical protein